eukprot:scaffold607_cov153-Pinguiococcus_pyrenoidosus.AAC.1
MGLVGRSLVQPAIGRDGRLHERNFASNPKTWTLRVHTPASADLDLNAMSYVQLPMQRCPSA